MRHQHATAVRSSSMQQNPERTKAMATVGRTTRPAYCLEYSRGFTHSVRQPIATCVYIFHVVRPQPDTKIVLYLLRTFILAERSIKRLTTQVPRVVAVTGSRPTDT